EMWRNSDRRAIVVLAIGLHEGSHVGRSQPTRFHRLRQGDERGGRPQRFELVNQFEQPAVQSAHATVHPMRGRSFARGSYRLLRWPERQWSVVSRQWAVVAVASCAVCTFPTPHSALPAPHSLLSTPLPDDYLAGAASTPAERSSWAFHRKK